MAIDAAQLRDGDGDEELPYNQDAEMLMLAALIQRNSIYEKISEFLRPEHFAIRAHSDIYRVIGKLISSGVPADAVTLKEYFERHEDLANSGGGWSYISQLALSIVSLLDAPNYAKVIHEYYMRRRAIEIADEIRKLGMGRELDRDLRAELAEKTRELEELHADTAERVGPRLIGEYVEPYLKKVERAHKANVGEVLGVPFGISGLDELTGGLPYGCQTIIGARSQMGKSAFMVRTALHQARTIVPEALRGAPGERTYRVAMFSLEMTADALLARLAAAGTQVPVSQQFRAGLSFDQMAAIVDWSGQLTGIPFYLDPTAKISAYQIRTRCARLKRLYGLDVVWIDYLQLAEGEGDIREREVAGISKEFSAMGKELDCAVAALSQVSRNCDGRENKRPGTADLRESGAIENDAELIIFLFREHRYLEQVKIVRGPKESEADYLDRVVDHDKKLAACKNKMEAIVDKNRQGALGTSHMYCDLATMTFDDLDDYQRGAFDARGYRQPAPDLAAGAWDPEL